MIDTLTGPVHGRADERLGEVVARLEAVVRNDPDF